MTPNLPSLPFWIPLLFGAGLAWLWRLTLLRLRDLDVLPLAEPSLPLPSVCLCIPARNEVREVGAALDACVADATTLGLGTTPPDGDVQSQLFASALAAVRGAGEQLRHLVAAADAALSPFHAALDAAIAAAESRVIAEAAAPALFIAGVDGDDVHAARR